MPACLRRVTVSVDASPVALLAVPYGLQFAARCSPRVWLRGRFSVPFVRRGDAGQ